MIPAHLRERFFQRYGMELTEAILVEIGRLAHASPVRERDAFLPGRERVWVAWRGQWVGLAWSTQNRYVVTFLPDSARPGSKPPGRGAARRAR